MAFHEWTPFRRCGSDFGELRLEAHSQVDDLDAGEDQAASGKHLGGLAAPKLEPKHTIFLSHSGEDKAFVHQLCTDLKALNYFPFFDQRRDSLPIGEEFPKLILEAARTCLVAVVVLSESFLTSKWPITELIEFAEATKPVSPSYNRNLRLVPVFYMTSADDLKPALLDNLWNKLVTKPGINPARLRFDQKDYVEAIGKLLKFNGLKNVHGKNETKYRKEVVTQLMKLVPPALPIDTSGIHGCERLCKNIFEMFRTKDVECKGKSVQSKYLGLFGKAGVGKTTICCEAMCHFYQEARRGRFCRVRLDSEKSGEGKADGEAVASRRRLARLMAVIKQLVGLPKSMSTIMTEHEGKRFLQKRLLHIGQPVFLVVDNVSDTTQHEANWYASCEFPSDSFVLVTSRRRDVLETVLEDPTYCMPFPNLDIEEAQRLFLSIAAPSYNKSLVTTSRAQDIVEELTPEQLKVVEECVRRCCVDDDEFIPRILMSFASFLKDKGSILGWREYIDHVDDIIGQEYDILDDTSKLIFLDLGIFANEMRFTHMDFHDELEWEEHDNSKLTIEFLAMLHGIPFHDVEKKVNDLRHSFLNESDNSVSEDISEFAVALFTRGGKMKKWCMLCMDVNEDMLNDKDFEKVADTEYFFDLPKEDTSELVRVGLMGVSFDSDLHRMSDWGSVKLLYIHAVRNLQTLDLQGLRSLCVLRVIQCEEIEKIVCSCNSSFTNKRFCYEKNRGCLSELRAAQLEYLPNLKEASFVMHSRRLETLWFYECPDIGCYPDLSLCRKLKQLRLPCGNFKSFKGLRNNRALTELAFHWETTTVCNFTEEMRVSLLKDVMNLENLKILDIVDEKELYDWIPADFKLDVGKLKFLTFLDLSCSSMIQHIHGLEELSELTSLGLYGCCELRSLPNPARFPKLRRLCIAHCHNLELNMEDEDYIPNSNFHSSEEFENYIAGPEPFHALGESCSFGVHECLDVNLNMQEELWDWEVHGEEDERQMGGICRQCDPRMWVEKYLAKDEGFARRPGGSGGPWGVVEHNYMMNIQSHYQDQQFGMQGRGSVGYGQQGWYG